MSLIATAVTLLDAPGENSAPTSASRNSQTPPLQRILVVDDEEVLRQLYSTALIRFGYQVDAAEDGEAAWQVLLAVTYDLLITDNNMPKLSGVKLIEKLNSAHRTLPVILASGTVPFNTEWLQLAAILPKPFSPDQLVQTVKQVLHGSTAAASNGASLNGSIAFGYGPDANKVLAGVLRPEETVGVEFDPSLRDRQPSASPCWHRRNGAAPFAVPMHDAATQHSATHFRDFSSGNTP